MSDIELIGVGVLVLAQTADGPPAVEAMNHRAATLLAAHRPAPGSPLTKFASPVLAERLAAAAARAVETGSEQELEAQVGSGSAQRWLRMAMAPTRDPAPARPRVVVTLTDVTGRKHAEARTLESELKLHALVEGSVQGIGILREDRILFCNEAGARIFGYRDPGAFCRAPSVTALIHPDDRERALGEIDALLRLPESSARVVYRAFRVDGSQVWMEARYSKVLWDDLPALQVTWVEVTERVLAEQALEESEERYRTLVESLPLGITVHIDGRGVFCNRFMANALGYDSVDGYVRASTEGGPLVHVPEARRAEALDVYARLASGELDEDRDETVLERRDATPMYVQIHARRIDWNGQAAVLTTLVDMTEQKQLESALGARETLLSTVFDAMPLWITMKDTKGRIIMMNRAAVDALDFPVDRLGAFTNDDLVSLSEEGRRLVNEEDRRVLAAGERIEKWDYPMPFIDGRELVVNSTRIPLRNDQGRITGILVVSQDVTELSQRRREAAERQALLEAVIDALPFWLSLKDPQGRYVMVNRAMAEDLNFPLERLGSFNHDDVYWHLPEGKARLEDMDRRVFESAERLESGPTRLERGLRTAAQTPEWWQVVKVPVSDQAGALIGLVSISMDVTDRVTADEQLRQSERLLRSVVANAPVILWALDAEGGITFSAGKALAPLRLSPDKLVGRSIFDQFVDQEEFQADVRRALAGEAVVAFHRHGETWHEHWLEPMLDEHGELDGVIGVSVDRTDRHIAERSLRDSEERYRAIVDDSLQGITVYATEDGAALFANTAYLDMLGYASLEDFMRVSRLHRGLSPEDERRIRPKLKRVTEGELGSYRDEIGVTLENGDFRWLEFLCHHTTWAGQSALQFAVVDITARKQTEEALQDRQAVLAKQNEFYRQNLNRRRDRREHGVVSYSPRMQRVLQEAEMVAASRVPVLIEGETGTGKEVVAEFIHRNSERADQMLSVVNCGALTENLMDAELFGHERGAFTGAGDARAGLIEIADRGTLFLDEIGDMPLNAQVRLLRFLERSVIRRVGSTRERKVDVRILAATHKTLRDQVRAGTFREDLYHRLLVIRIEVPPLRERIEDILPLAEHFIAEACAEAHLDVKPLTDETRLALTSYGWPGNVRELSHTVQRAVLSANLDRSVELRPEHTGLPLHGSAGAAFLPIKEVMRLAEREHVLTALRHYEGNRRKTAQALGISERHLYRLMQ